MDKVTVHRCGAEHFGRGDRRNIIAFTDIHVMVSLNDEEVLALYDQLGSVAADIQQEKVRVSNVKVSDEQT